jgi:hypothetical protein
MPKQRLRNWHSQGLNLTSSLAGMASGKLHIPDAIIVI